MQDSQTPLRTRFTAHFLVIGGGLSGLAAAIALRRVGHEVLVLEKGSSLGEGTSGHSGYRIPPNMTKILYNWGLETDLKALGIVSSRFHLSRLGDAATLSCYDKKNEMMKEVCGETLCIDRYHLRRVLFSKALALGAKIRMNADVVTVVNDGRSVQLLSGETIQSDIIIGAGGQRGLVRRTLLKGKLDTRRDTGLVMFDAVLPRANLRNDPEVKQLLDEELSTEHVWFGDRHAVILFPISRESVSFHLYTPSQGTPNTHRGLATIPVARFESRVQKLVAMATSATCIDVAESDILDNWVHPSGRCVAIGQAAHPFVPGSIQGSAMGLEDASALAKLFSHLRNEDQIPSFLSAFQEIRQDRCREIMKIDSRNLREMTREDNESTRERDLAMQALHRAGVPLYKPRSTPDDVHRLWIENWKIYSYNAEDAADNWWVTWGVVQLRLTSTEDLTDLTPMGAGLGNAA